MIKEEAKLKREKPGKPVTFRESAAKAFQDVLRTAARKNREIALSIEGKSVVIDAKQLQKFLSHRHNDNSIEKEILQYAKVNNL